jgi:protoheme IX farnesyltransferase
MSVLGPTDLCAARPATAWGGRSLSARLSDYVEIAKPRISLLVLVTTCLGWALGATGTWDPAGLFHVLCGVALVAASSSAFNQILERDTDARMGRTARRPIPSGRMSVTEVAAFGATTGVVGVAWLAATVGATTALLAAGTWLAYVAAYTPLKRRTGLCTAVGAVPGAMPPVLGWTAAGGALDEGAVSLFAVLYLWQFPHFLAIGWMYRDQYVQAGLRMLPSRDGSRTVAGLSAVAHALVLIPASLLPRWIGLAGGLYAAAALCLGLGYLWFSIGFLRGRTPDAARRLLWASLGHLPALLTVLTLDHFRLLR